MLFSTVSRCHIVFFVVLILKWVYDSSLLTQRRQLIFLNCVLLSANRDFYANSIRRWTFNGQWKYFYHQTEWFCIECIDDGTRKSREMCVKFDSMRSYNVSIVGHVNWYKKQDKLLTFLHAQSKHAKYNNRVPVNFRIILALFPH